MKLNDYQNEAQKTQLPQCDSIEYLALGLAGEAGEIAEKVKKMLRGDYDEDELKSMLLGELGDNLWYIAMIAKRMGWELNDVAQFNVQKLTRRKADDKIKGNGDTR